MRLVALAAAALAMLTLGACVSTGPRGQGTPPPVLVNPGSQPAPSPLARSAHFTCEDLTSITLTEGQSQAAVTLNSGLTLSLQAQGGGRYGGTPYEFRAHGSDGTWINQGRANRCRAK